jgi:hypothetical protein
MKAKIVRIEVEEGNTGLFYATSPDLKGLLVAKPTIEALEQAIPLAVADLFAACGVKVIVTRAEKTQGEVSTPWIAFPAELARQALANS